MFSEWNNILEEFADLVENLEYRMQSPIRIKDQYTGILSDYQYSIPIQFTGIVLPDEGIRRQHEDLRLKNLFIYTLHTKTELPMNAVITYKNKQHYLFTKEDYNNYGTFFRYVIIDKKI